MVRDEKGRFSKDNGGGPGRPRKTDEQEVKRVFKKAIPPDYLVSKIKEGVDQNKEWAIKLAAYYEFDMPTQPVQNNITGDVVITVTRTHNGK